MAIVAIAAFAAIYVGVTRSETGGTYTQRGAYCNTLFNTRAYRNVTIALFLATRERPGKDVPSRAALWFATRGRIANITIRAISVS